VFAAIESVTLHPDWTRERHYPDVAVLYLDRELPFEPLPLARFPIDASWTGKKATIAGWGGSRALSADISQVEGSGIKRSARVKLLGTPTLADYHADDPNPAMLTVVTLAARELRLRGLLGSTTRTALV
jgi:hypothetical protein